MKRYETPEVIELGAAHELTLGSPGACPDACVCSLAGDEDHA